MDLDDAFDFVDVEISNYGQNIDDCQVQKVQKADSLATDPKEIPKEEENIEDDFAFEYVEFATMEKYDKTKGNCTEQGTLSCSDCGYTTNKRRTLRYHIQTRHEIKIKSEDKDVKPEILVCSLCSYTSDKRRNLRDHVREYHEKRKGDEEEQCTQCDYKTALLKNLKRHIQSFHSSSKGFSCVHCDYKSRYKSSLRRHQEKEHGDGKGKLTCSKCEYSTGSGYALKEHITRVHQKSETFKCEFCTYSTHYEKNLMGHLEGQHDDSRFFECSFDGCDYR